MIRRNLPLVFTLMVISVGLTGCMSIQQRLSAMMDRNPYEEEPFYYRYLRPSESALDAEVIQVLEAVRQEPDSAILHNRLGSLLVEMGFFKDAETEFLRAVRADDRFHPAWYNLGLARQAQRDDQGALRAFRQTLRVKSGHAAAHFQVGLMLEKSGRREAALDHYVQAYRINEALLDVRVNPLVLDSDLVDLALIRLYPDEHVKRALRYEPAPPGYPVPAYAEPEAPSEVAEPEEIVTPEPPASEQP